MPANLPETLDEFGISEDDLKEYYSLYVNWVTLDRRYPPSVLIREDDRILSFFIAMDNIYARLEKIKSNQDSGKI